MTQWICIRTISSDPPLCRLWMTQICIASPVEFAAPFTLAGTCCWGWAMSGEEPAVLAGGRDQIAFRWLPSEEVGHPVLWSHNLAHLASCYVLLRAAICSSSVSFASVKVAPALATPLPVAPAKEASRKLFGSLAVSDHICLISCNSFGMFWLIMTTWLRRHPDEGWWGIKTSTTFPNGQTFPCHGQEEGNLGGQTFQDESFFQCHLYIYIYMFFPLDQFRGLSSKRLRRDPSSVTPKGSCKGWAFGTCVVDEGSLYV